MGRRAHDGGVRFTYHAADGEEGYPGAMDVAVDYVWNDDNELTISYEQLPTGPPLSILPTMPTSTLRAKARARA